MINSMFYFRRNANFIHEKVNQVNQLVKMIEDVNEKLKTIDDSFQQEDRYVKEVGKNSIFLQIQSLWLAQSC